VQLAIVNDAPGYYVPLMSFSMPQLAFNLSGGQRVLPVQAGSQSKAGTEQGSNFTLDVSLAINYFNQQLMTWEPAFENWRYTSSHHLLSSCSLHSLTVVSLVCSFHVAGNTFKVTLTSAEVRAI
jgi:hypothetical protein